LQDIYTKSNSISFDCRYLIKSAKPQTRKQTQTRAQTSAQEITIKIIIFALAYINLNFNLKLRQSSGKNYTSTQNIDAYRMWPRIIPMPCVCLKLGMLLHNLGGKAVTTTADAQSLSWKPLRQSHAHFTLALAGFC